MRGAPRGATDASARFRRDQAEILKCGQTFCSGCLAQLEKPECPTCREPWCAGRAHRAARRSEERKTDASCAERGLADTALARQARRPWAVPQLGVAQPGGWPQGVLPLRPARGRRGRLGARAPDRRKRRHTRRVPARAAPGRCRCAREELRVCARALRLRRLRESQEDAHDVEAAAAHARGERAERLAERARADKLQQQLDEVEPHAVSVIEKLMSPEEFLPADATRIVEWMTLPGSSATVVSTACDAMEKFTECAVRKGDDSLLAHLLDVGGVDALVAALRTHGASVSDVAESACEALANVVSHRPAAHKALRLGVVPALLAALAAHMCDANVQEAGLRLMAGLLFVDPDEDGGEALSTVDLAVRRALKNGGALACILAVMQGHLDEDAVQVWVVKSLCGMLPLDAASAVTAVASVQTVVKDAYVDYIADDSRLLRLCFSLLRHCVAAANLPAEAASELVGVIVSAMRASIADVGVQLSGVSALAALLTVRRVPAGLTGRAVAVIAVGMSAHPVAHELQQSGLRVLTSLATLDAEGAPAAGSLSPGSLARILSLVQAGATVAEETQQPHRSGDLVLPSRSRIDVAVPAGALSVLKAALTAFGADMTVAEYVLCKLATEKRSALFAALPAVGLPWRRMWPAPSCSTPAAPFCVAPAVDNSQLAPPSQSRHACKLSGLRCACTAKRMLCLRLTRCRC